MPGGGTNIRMQEVAGGRVPGGGTRKLQEGACLGGDNEHSKCEICWRSLSMLCMRSMFGDLR